MEKCAPRFERHIFVCINTRAPEARVCCNASGDQTGLKIRDQLKARVKELKLDEKIRVSGSGCLDVCEEGPNVLIQPDNVWLKGVRLEDVPQIVEEYVARSHV